jgi:hypothetical protein
MSPKVFSPCLYRICTNILLNCAVMLFDYVLEKLLVLPGEARSVRTIGISQTRMFLQNKFGNVFII